MFSLKNSDILKELVAIGENAAATITGGCSDIGPVAGGPPPSIRNPWDDLRSPNIETIATNSLQRVA